jgi:putative endonuclease
MESGPMTTARQELGESGENLAVSELEARGYAILERRYRTRYGEIDIIARHCETLVFVEVRRKSGEGYGAAVESITPDKRRRVVRMAVEYLARTDLYDKCQVRFDVIAIDDQPDGTSKMTLIQAAFEA